MSIDKDLEVIEQHAEDMKCRYIDAIRAKVPKGIGAEFCGCGNEVGKPRRNHGFSNCIECAQAEYEHSKKFGRIS